MILCCLKRFPGALLLNSKFYSSGQTLFTEKAVKHLDLSPVLTYISLDRKGLDLYCTFIQYVKCTCFLIQNLFMRCDKTPG